MSAAGPSQDAKASPGGSEPHAMGERGGNMSAHEHGEAVDELAAARLQIAQLQADLVLARAGIEDLASSLSHDLRAPLRHVTSFVEVIREDLQACAAPVEPQIYASLDKVAQAARHQARMIEALVDLSRIGRAPLAIVAVPLASLVTDLQAALAPALQGREVQWLVPDDLPTVASDLVLLRGVLGHLLDNALKFSRPRAPAQIGIGWRRVGADELELTVHDNGVGCGSRMQDKLFHPFQRLHSAAEFEGLGMGLAWSRAAVKRLGGSIALHSETDQGCRLTLRLPDPGRAGRQAPATPGG